jgi:hypothetical protein
MTTDRTMVERALRARAERIAGIDRRWHGRCYACGGDRFAPSADGDLVLCVYCQELVDPASIGGIAAAATPAAATSP